TKLPSPCMYMAWGSATLEMSIDQIACPESDPGAISVQWMSCSTALCSSTETGHHGMNVMRENRPSHDSKIDRLPSASPSRRTPQSWGGGRKWWPDQSAVPEAERTTSAPSFLSWR